MLLITGIIADGNNPYTREFQPYAADVYPPLYNMVVAPLTGIFGNTFQLHRVISGLCIAMAATLVGLATVKESGSRIQGAAASTLLYAALLFYATPVSSTNALGVALFLYGVIIPWWRGFSTGSLIFALICSLLSFYTKQYFILGMAILCLYLFLYVSMLRALCLGFLFAVLLASSLYLVHQSSPYYLDNTLFAPSAAISGLQMWDILFLQMRVYLQTYSGLLIVIVIAGITIIANKTTTRKSDSTVSDSRVYIESWNSPLVTKPANFFLFCLFWSTLVIILWLGRNPGNYMTYLFQLMSPFLLIYGFSVIARLTGKLAIITPIVLFSFYQSYNILHKDFSTNIENWEKMEVMIAGSDNVLATQMLVSTLLKHDKKVFQDGHTFYLPLAVNKPTWMIKEREEDRISTVWAEYISEIYDNIEDQKFDLILVSPWEMRGIFLRNPPPRGGISGKEFLRRYYAVDEKIKLSMTDRHGGGTYDIAVWRPKSTQGAQ
ncbi:MAG: hypothetical protein ABJK25_08765 [Halieaceae bacterium]